MITSLLQLGVADCEVFNLSLLLQLAQMVNDKNVLLIDADFAVRLHIGVSIAKTSPKWICLARSRKNVFNALKTANLELFGLSGNHFFVEGHEQRGRVQHYWPTRQ